MNPASDIALDWLARFIESERPEAGRVAVNRDLLRCYPAPDGMMHDELMVGHSRANIHFWAAAERRAEPKGELDASVITRLGYPSVRNYSGFGPYRPTSLQDHPAAKRFYS
jgi:hypothetical protein